jgi:phosphatidylcholine synthase
MSALSIAGEWRVWRARAVHIYTSLGLPCAFLALLAAQAGQARTAFIILLVAILIDGTDGPLARRWDVKRWTPNFDGRKLDDIIDYLTYVFVPAFILYQFQLIAGWGTLALLMALLVSAYRFVSTDAKTDDKHFTGFPSYWNVVALFMVLLKSPPEANAIVILMLAVMVLLPLKFPSSQALSRLEWIAMGLCGALVIYLLLFGFENPSPMLVYLALIYPIYHVVAPVIKFLRGAMLK